MIALKFLKERYPTGCLRWLKQLLILKEICDALIIVSHDPMIRIIVPIIILAYIVEKCL